MFPFKRGSPSGKAASIRHRAFTGGVAASVLMILLVVAGAPMVAGANPTWSVASSRNYGGSDSINSLDGVSCVSATSCTAVGSYVSPSGVDRTLIESWNGTAWTLASSRNYGTSESTNYLKTFV